MPHPKSARRAMVTVVAVIILVPAILGGFVLRSRAKSAGSARLLEQVLQLVSTRAVDSLGADALYEKAARGLVRGLDDPYAGLYSPTELASFMRNAIGNAYGGLGVSIEDQDGAITVGQVFSGSPAANGGVERGDRIVAIDGEPVVKWSIDKVSQHLVGKDGTQVEVVFARAGVSEPVKTRFTRAIVHAPSVPYAMMVDEKTGYVPLERFNETASVEMARAIGSLRLKGATAFVIDLRGNPGGDLDQALAVSNLFLKRGLEIAQLRGRGATPEIHRSVDGAILTSEPVVILVDGYSASASEIVAGALQDHDRALVVGTPSFGKGLAQSIYTLDGGYALKLTTAKWYTPSGRSIQRERKFVDGKFVAEDTSAAARDSLKKAPRPAYKSDAGRVVYGGGGVTPDVTVDADTITAPEQQLLRALAPKASKARGALFDVSREVARDVKGSAQPDFSVAPAWRESYYRRLTSAGIIVDRAMFDAAMPLIDRMIGRQVASFAFGDSTAFRHSIPDDAQLKKALALLKHAVSQTALLAEVATARNE
ncbi:MAG: S41 family peptidase [Gemmatimonadaceae bacterium]